MTVQQQGQATRADPILRKVWHYTRKGWQYTCSEGEPQAVLEQTNRVKRRRIVEKLHNQMLDARSA